MGEGNGRVKYSERREEKAAASDGLVQIDISCFVNLVDKRLRGCLAEVLESAGCGSIRGAAADKPRAELTLLLPPEVLSPHTTNQTPTVFPAPTLSPRMAANGTSSPRPSRPTFTISDSDADPNSRSSRDLERNTPRSYNSSSSPSRGALSSFFGSLPRPTTIPHDIAEDTTDDEAQENSRLLSSSVASNGTPSRRAAKRHYSLSGYGAADGSPLRADGQVLGPEPAGEQQGAPLRRRTCSVLQVGHHHSSFAGCGASVIRSRLASSGQPCPAGRENSPHSCLPRRACRLSAFNRRKQLADYCKTTADDRDDRRPQQPVSALSQVRRGAQGPSRVAPKPVSLAPPANIPLAGPHRA